MEMRHSHPDIRKFLVERYRQFQQEGFPENRKLFETLAQGQKPRVLFITCSDSRVVPSLILSGDPGDIFECQIVGNIVPAYGDSFGGVSATLEYAITVLGVQAVIVCGHSDCGAMKAVHDSEQVAHLTAVAMWLRHTEAAKRIIQNVGADMSQAEQIALLTRENVIAQIENMRTHPAVALGRRNGLQILGWVYNIQTGEVENYDEETRSFRPL
jgi:carbonic anhydrase